MHFGGKVRGRVVFLNRLKNWKDCRLSLKNDKNDVHKNDVHCRELLFLCVVDLVLLWKPRPLYGLHTSPEDIGRDRKTRLSTSLTHCLSIFCSYFRL